MALAFRLKDAARTALIRFDRGPPAAKADLFVAIDSQTYRLQSARLNETDFALTSLDFELESLLLGASHASIVVIYDTLVDGLPVYEALTFHHSFFVPFFDFTACNDIYSAPGRYDKPGTLAVFTHVYNDGAMLQIWEHHYSAMTPHKNLYVIDHGSLTSPRGLLHPDVTVVTVPRGEVDHRAIAHFCNTFQRFLLSQYRWVIHVDADELLIDSRGCEGLTGRLLERGGAVIVKPGHAVNLVQSIADETRLDLSRPVTAQRHWLVPAPTYDKPVLSSIPATRSMGFHFALERVAVAADDALWLVHLKFADLDLYLQSSRRWKTIESTEASLSDRLYARQDERMTHDVEARQLFAAMLEDPGSPKQKIPDWMRGMF